MTSTSAPRTAQLIRLSIGLAVTVTSTLAAVTSGAVPTPLLAAKCFGVGALAVLLGVVASRRARPPTVEPPADAPRLVQAKPPRGTFGRPTPELVAEFDRKMARDGYERQPDGSWKRPKRSQP